MDSPRAFIVIVEDDASLGHALDRLLGAAGFATRCFASAEALLGEPGAVSAAACLLLDIHLPGASGFELMDRLRERTGTPSLPVLLMTADDSVATHRRAVQATGVPPLVKPMESERLLSAIARALGGAQGGSPSGPDRQAGPPVRRHSVA